MANEKPKLGQITQGTIYSAAAAENYFGFPTWGLCITARCDVAHETKTEVFNYVPVVRYEDWLLVDGFRTLFNRIKAEHVGVLKSSLSQAKLSSSVLETYSPSVVVNKFFPSTEKTDQKIKKIHECAAAIEEIQELRSKSSISAVQLKNICSTSSKTAEKLAKELWGNQLSGYYFLKDIGETEHGSNCGYVILLREIHHISRDAAALIGGGITELESIEKKISSLNFSVMDFSYPIAKLSSPWIEHVMQQFSTLFNRIGLPDSPESTFPPLLEAFKNGK